LIDDKITDLPVEILDLTNGKSLKTIIRNGAGTIFSDAAVSPDGKLLALDLRNYKAPQKHVQLIEISTGRVVREILHEGEWWFSSVAFIPSPVEAICRALSIRSP